MNDIEIAVKLPYATNIHTHTHTYWKMCRNNFDRNHNQLIDSLCVCVWLCVYGMVLYGYKMVTIILLFIYDKYTCNM